MGRRSHDRVLENGAFMLFTHCASFNAFKHAKPLNASLFSLITFSRFRSTMFTLSRNALTGKMEWVPQSDEYDFKQEIARSG